MHMQCSGIIHYDASATLFSFKIKFLYIKVIWLTTLKESLTSRKLKHCPIKALSLNILLMYICNLLCLCSCSLMGL